MPEGWHGISVTARSQHLEAQVYTNRFATYGQIGNFTLEGHIPAAASIFYKRAALRIFWNRATRIAEEAKFPPKINDGISVNLSAFLSKWNPAESALGAEARPKPDATA
jgi:hypothetical protein